MKHNATAGLTARVYPATRRRIGFGWPVLLVCSSAASVGGCGKAAANHTGETVIAGNGSLLEGGAPASGSGNSNGNGSGSAPRGRAGSNSGASGSASDAPGAGNGGVAANGAGANGAGTNGAGTNGAGAPGSGSAGSASGSAAGGAASGQAVFPLKISADKNHLTGADGTPFLLRGDSAWSALAELSRTDSSQYLDSRQAHGFNAVISNLIESDFSSHDPRWRNAEGEVPFTNADDWTTLNDAYFTHVDWFLSEAQKRGILVVLAPAYIGYGCGSEGWCAHMKANGVAKLTQYGQYLGNRYKSFANILWLNSGDYTPSTSGNPSELDLVNAVANGIRSAEAGVHLHAAHWATETSGGEGPAVPWLDVDTTYSYTSPHLYQKTLSDHARDDGKRPVFLVESMYENEHSTTGTQLRAQMYQPVLSGGSGFMFGNFPIWAMWNPGDQPWQFDNGLYPGGWKTALDGKGTKLATIAFQFFGSIAWQTLTPDVSNKVLVGGFGSGDNFALCAANSAGTLAVTYATSNLALQFDMSKFKSTVRARWFDPALGTYSDASPSTVPNSGKVTFTPPATDGDGSADWVLLLQAN